MAQSAWIQHVPFGMFLVDVLRPRVIVELGTYAGVSYCGFCEAVKTLRLDTFCYAVDTWQGDAHSGEYDDSIYEDLKSEHDPKYGDFSRLIRSTFDEALVHFADGSIDLLHIDGLHTYEAVKADYENWRSKMSSRGVVIFHDTNERQTDFGVWKLWGELQHDFPNFEMFHGHGLGVLAVGSDIPKEIAPLFSLSEVQRTGVREFFFQLGARLELAQEHKATLRSFKNQTDAVLQLSTERNAQQTQLNELQNLLGVRLHNSVAERGVGGTVRKALGKILKGNR
ncbi:MAG: class I SAM-dependent methyltransferase [Gemmatimonadaceae bacterium]